MFGGGQPLSSRFLLIAIFQMAEDFLKVGDGFAQRANHGLAVFGEDFRPHFRVSGGHAGGVPQVRRRRNVHRAGLPRQTRGRAGGDDVRQVADPRDEFVVSRRVDPCGAAADTLPETLQRIGFIRGNLFVVGEQAGGIAEQIRAGGGQAVALRAGHRVAADELDPAALDQWCEAGVRRAFHTADIRDQATRGKSGIECCGNQRGHRAHRDGENQQVAAINRLSEVRGGVWNSDLVRLPPQSPFCGPTGGHGRSEAASAMASEPPSRPPPRMAIFEKSALIRKKPGPVVRTRSVFREMLYRKINQAQGTRKYFFSAAG